MSTMIKKNGNWVTVAGGTRMWVGTKAALQTALDAGELVDGTAVMVTDDYEEGTDIYSTSETKTNKVWVDGKPIYRKVIHYTGVVIAGTTSVIIGNITGFADIVSFAGTFKNNNDDNYFSLNYTWTDAGSTVKQNIPFVINANGNVVVARPYGLDITNINIIVEYTKA